MLFIRLSIQFSSIQSLSCVWLFASPWTAVRQASLSITNSRSPPKPMSIESVMPSSHLILCCPLFLLPPIPPSIRVFSSESTLHMRWPKYWSFSFSISPSSEHPGLVRWWNSSWSISNPERWCCESAALNMPANWENSAVATGLEKVNFHSKTHI